MFVIFVLTFYSPVVTIEERIEIGKGALACMQSTFFYIHDTQKEDPDPGCHGESQQKLQDNLDDRPVINKDRSVKL